MSVSFLRQYAVKDNKDPGPVATPPPNGNYTQILNAQSVINSVDPVLTHLAKVVVRSKVTPGDTVAVAKALAAEMERLKANPAELGKMLGHPEPEGGWDSSDAVPTTAGGDDGPRLNA